MKAVLSRKKFVVLLAALCLAGVTAWPQMSSPSAPGGMSGALTRLFGTVKAFTSKANVRVLDSKQEQIANMPMDFAFLNGKIRVEMDLAKMENRNMPPGMPAALKRRGMAQVITIVRPDKKLAYAVYPDQKAVLSMPLPPSDETTNSSSELKRSELGKATIEGQPCIKNKVLVPDTGGKTIEAITWNATDLRNFPIRIETAEHGNTSIVSFSHVQFDSPDPQEFDPPAGYTVYTDPAEFQQAVTKGIKGETPPK